jgi:hypothetical protein
MTHPTTLMCSAPRLGAGKAAVAAGEQAADLGGGQRRRQPGRGAVPAQDAAQGVADRRVAGVPGLAGQGMRPADGGEAAAERAAAVDRGDRLRRRRQRLVVVLAAPGGEVGPVRPVGPPGRRREALGGVAGGLGCGGERRREGAGGQAGHTGIPAAWGNSGKRYSPPISGNYQRLDRARFPASPGRRYGDTGAGSGRQGMLRRPGPGGPLPPLAVICLTAGTSAMLPLPRRQVPRASARRGHCHGTRGDRHPRRRHRLARHRGRSGRRAAHCFSPATAPSLHPTHAAVVIPSGS